MQQLRIDLKRDGSGVRRLGGPVFKQAMDGRSLIRWRECLGSGVELVQNNLPLNLVHEVHAVDGVLSCFHHDFQEVLQEQNELSNPLTLIVLIIFNLSHRLQPADHETFSDAYQKLRPYS